MNHTNSNLNISKKNKQIKSSNKNNFNKSSKYKKNNFISKINFINNINNNFYHTNTNNNCYNSIDFALTKTSSNKVSQLHLPYKDSIKSSIISNKNENKSKNKKYTLKISNSNKFLSFNGIYSKNIYNSSHKNSHNIRLNLNHEIINKNFPTENNRTVNKRKNNDIYYKEKIKEKNIRINKLKKDLILSEMILNKLKNKDNRSDMLYDINYDSVNYENTNSNNNITKINFYKNHRTLTLNFNGDNCNFNNKKVNSLTNIGPIGSILTFNYINNNISYNNNYKKSVSPENKSIHKNNYFYSLPNRNNFNYNKGSLSTKNDNKTKIIFIKKSGPFCEKNVNDDKPKNDDFKKFVEKCDDLKKRTKILLNKYIKLSEFFSKNDV